MNTLFGFIGKSFLKSTDHILSLLIFTSKLLQALFRPSKKESAAAHKAAVEQIYAVFVEALPIIIPVALIIGSLMIVQFNKIANQFDAGKALVLLIIKEPGPLVTAILVIFKSAVRITIETATLKLTDKIDALENSGKDPMHLICLPVLIGIVLSILSLFIVFGIVSILGGYALVWSTTHIPLHNFFGQITQSISAADIIIGIAKVLCFGITIAVTCLYCGLRMDKDIGKLAQTTSRTILECFFYCLIIDTIISALTYG